MPILPQEISGGKSSQAAGSFMQGMFTKTSGMGGFKE